MYDVGVMGNGALAGLVAITSGTSTIEPWGAIIVGFVAGALYILGSKCSVWFKVRQPLASRSSNECLIGSFTHLISREMAGKESMRVSLSPPPFLAAGLQPCERLASLQTAALVEDAGFTASDPRQHACLDWCVLCAECGRVS